MHRHMYTATYRTVRYGWRVGIAKSIVIVTGFAPKSGLTLPYLTYLTYLTYFTYTAESQYFELSASLKTRESGIEDRGSGIEDRGED